MNFFFVTIVRVRAIVLTSLFSLFYVTCEFHRFLHRGRAGFSVIFDLTLLPGGREFYSNFLENVKSPPNALPHPPPPHPLSGLTLTGALIITICDDVTDIFAITMYDVHILMFGYL